MPGIREAIEQRNWKEAQEQIEITAAALKRLSRITLIRSSGDDSRLMTGSFFITLPAF